MRMRPETLADAVERNIGSGLPLYHHVNEFLDEFYLRPDDRQWMINDEPKFIGIDRDDAWIGGVAEHLANRWKLSIPKWVMNPKRFLHEPYFVGGHGPRVNMHLLMQSPMAFRRRLIFTEYEPLRRARFPQE